MKTNFVTAEGQSVKHSDSTTRSSANAAQHGGDFAQARRSLCAAIASPRAAAAAQNFWWPERSRPALGASFVADFDTRHSLPAPARSRAVVARVWPQRHPFHI